MPNQYHDRRGERGTSGRAKRLECRRWSPTFDFHQSVQAVERTGHREGDRVARGFGAALYKRS